jgi:hypothetical protein
MCAEGLTSHALCLNKNPKLPSSFGSRPQASSSIWTWLPLFIKFHASLNAASGDGESPVSRIEELQLILATQQHRGLAVTFRCFFSFLRIISTAGEVQRSPCCFITSKCVLNLSFLQASESLKLHSDETSSLAIVVIAVILDIASCKYLEHSARI